MILSVLERRAFDFSATSGPEREQVLVRHLDVLAYRTAVLVVRVHSASVGSGSKLSVQAFRCSPSPDDPDADFVETSPLATAAITTSTSQRSVRDVLLAPFGSHIQVRLSADPPASPITLTATLSVALVLLEAP